MARCTGAMELCTGTTGGRTGATRRCTGATELCTGTTDRCTGTTRLCTGAIKLRTGTTGDCTGTTAHCTGATELCTGTSEGCTGAMGRFPGEKTRVHDFAHPRASSSWVGPFTEQLSQVRHGGRASPPGTAGVSPAHPPGDHGRPVTGAAAPKCEKRRPDRARAVRPAGRRGRRGRGRAGRDGGAGFPDLRAVRNLQREGHPALQHRRRRRTAGRPHRPALRQGDFHREPPPARRPDRRLQVSG
jgi:hypothetical protein